MNKNIETDLIMRKNQLLQAENYKLKADLDYIAMMTDVDIPTDESEEQPNE